MMSQHFGGTTCQALPNGEDACGAKIEKSQALCDVHGYYWCKKHEKRGKLLNWARQNRYPGISFTSMATGTRYAIGYDGDDDLWKVPILMGSEDMINAAYDAVFGSSGEEEL